MLIFLNLNSSFVKTRTRNCQGGSPGEGFCFTSIIGTTETRECDSGKNKYMKSKTVLVNFFEMLHLLIFTQKLVHPSHLNYKNTLILFGKIKSTISLFISQ